MGLKENQMEAKNQEKMLDNKTDSSIPQDSQDISVKKRSFIERIRDYFKDRDKVLSVLFLLAFVIVIIVLACLGLDMGQIMKNIIDWFENKVGILGLYIGVFLISIFGNFTIIFPVPYTMALVAIATRPYVDMLNIFLMGLSAGLGAAIGETTAWLTGKASKILLEGGMEKQISQAKNWIDKGLAPLIIFIFAATPLPDDAILVFIGLLGYALWKTILWCFLGKIILTSGTGLAAKYLVGTSVGRWLFWAFGLEPDGSIGQPTPIWLSALSWIVSIVLIGLILFVDWPLLWEKSVRKIVKRRYRIFHEKTLNNSRVILDEQYLDICNFQESWKTANYTGKENKPWQVIAITNSGDYSSLPDFYPVQEFLSTNNDYYLTSYWFNKFKSNIDKEHFPKLEKLKIEKIIQPIKVKNDETHKLSEDELNDYVVLSLKTTHPNHNQNFSISLLLKRNDQEKLRIHSLNKREALVLASFEDSVREQIFLKLLGIMEALSDKPKKTKIVKIGK